MPKTWSKKLTIGGATLLQSARYGTWHIRHKNEANYDAALSRLGELWGARLDTPEGDELDILILLIDAYEEKHHPIPAPDPIAAITTRMEEMGLTRRALEPMIGPSGRVSEVLTGKRPLTLAMIRRLRMAPGLPADVLIGP